MRAYMVFSLAVFFSFSIVGFVDDLFSKLATPIPMVIIWSVYSGSVASGYVYGFTRSLKSLPYIIFVQVGFLFIPWSSLFPWMRVVNESQKLMFDGFGIIVGVILGYIFFVSFIRGEGIKQIRMQAEMDMASAMHDVLVPAIDFNSPKFEIYGYSNPAQEIGGDLIDFSSNEKHTTCYIADVSGHGIDAGLLMGMFKASIHSMIQRDISLTDLINETNRNLFDLKKKSMFITCSILRLYPNKTAEFVIAGHLPILHFQKEIGKVSRLMVKQIPVTAKSDFIFTSRSINYSSGDLFVFITDGMNEAMNKKGELFGLDNIEKLVVKNNLESSKKVLNIIMNEVKKYGKQTDDQSAIIVKVLA